MAKSKTTPMMKQYRQIKSKLPEDTILFFRLGDFYEMFFEDARIASQVLDIALTKRNQVPMCGIPYHAADQYLAKLIRAGKKVAVCDQVEDAATAKGIVRRDVTGIVTPGTVTTDSVLDSNRNNYLAAVYHCEGLYGLALLDLSTGTFTAEETKDAAVLRDNLKRFAPNECLVPEEQGNSDAMASVLDQDLRVSILVTGCDDWIFNYDAAHDFLIRHFEVHSLEGFGCEGRGAIVGAAGGALYHVREELQRSISHVRSFRVGAPGEFMVLDEATCVNLDLVSNRGRGSVDGAPTTLLKVLDRTATAMGGRMLREWVLRPLVDIDQITERHDVVEELCNNRQMLHDTREQLGSVRDLERLIARLGSGSGNARDLRAVNQSLCSLPSLKELVGHAVSGLMKSIADDISLLPHIADLIDAAIVDEPPATSRDGGIIRKGYDAGLDELRDAASEGKQWLADFQAREKERTGIKNLKVRHNKVFGYYIEVSKSQLDSVPEEYIRKQTLVNAERFITPEIKEYEQKIMGAQERSIALEQEMFGRIREEVVAETEAIQATASALAQLDILAAFADGALVSRYARPVMSKDTHTDIREGRHPVVEQMPDAERFVPNDTLLDCDENQLLIITGPNMAGKSTYIRQVAQLVIMAQTGSFIPAASAELGIVDRVFTRVGASDDLVRGRSTFMVEMQETANILNNATERSLVVLDEIGRGTSTFDGISIAWAVAEFLHNNDHVKARTLFATHYHELTDLALTMQGVKNYNVLVREKGQSIVFLRKIAAGCADKSYGIQVARLAGLPPQVIDRATEILMNLEEGELSDTGKPKIAQRRQRKGKFDPGQMNLFVQDSTTDNE